MRYLCICREKRESKESGSKKESLARRRKKHEKCRHVYEAKGNRTGRVLESRFGNRG
ncbi:hypothetical protein OIU74_010867, partial [Salix koriyanagi]